MRSLQPPGPWSLTSGPPGAAFNVELELPPRSEPEAHAIFERWRADHAEHIRWAFTTPPPSPRLRARVGREALAALPAGARWWTLQELEPHLAVAARVRDVVTASRGRELRGTAHFAPGDLVYAHAAHSGDGYERVFFTGRDRETGRWATMICETRRFDRWQRLPVEDPELLFQLATRGGYWTEKELTRDLLTYVGAHLRDPTRHGWDQTEWDHLASRALVPSRPRLAACLSTVLGLEESEAKTCAQESGVAGALLRRAWRAPQSAAKNKHARVKPAWEHLTARELAAEREEASSRRRFAGLPTLRTGRPEPSPPLGPRPHTLTAVVAWCCDVAAILRVEALARRVADLFGMPANLPIVWRIADRPLVIGWLRRPPSPSSLEAAQATTLAALRSLVIELLDGRPRPAPDFEDAPRGEALRECFALGKEIVSLGYALDEVAADRIELLAPDLPHSIGPTSCLSP